MEIAVCVARGCVHTSHRHFRHARPERHLQGRTARALRRDGSELRKDRAGSPRKKRRTQFCFALGGAVLLVRSCFEGACRDLPRSYWMDLVWRASMARSSGLKVCISFDVSIQLEWQVPVQCAVQQMHVGIYGGFVCWHSKFSMAGRMQSGAFGSYSAKLSL